MDHSPIHKSTAVMDEMANVPVQLAPHPPYSPDLDLSNFFLFEYAKEKMIGQEFDSPKDLITWNQATIEAIPNGVLEHLFEEWIRRVQRCIGHEGSSFSKWQQMVDLVFLETALGVRWFRGPWTTRIFVLPQSNPQKSGYP
jgi:hypothetical protein